MLSDERQDLDGQSHLPRLFSSPAFHPTYQPCLDISRRVGQRLHPYVNIDARVARINEQRQETDESIVGRHKLHIGRNTDLRT
jgi:hypothetical protein